MTTTDGRRHALREMVRSAAPVSLANLMAADGFRLSIGAWAMIATRSEARRATEATRVDGTGDGDLGKAIADAYESSNEIYDALYAAMARLVGGRVRNGLHLRDFTLAGSALLEGFALRGLVDGQALHKIVIDDSEWSPFAFAFDALVDHYFEIDEATEPEPAELVLLELLSGS